MLEQTGEYCHGEGDDDVDKVVLDSLLLMERSCEDLLG